MHALAAHGMLSLIMLLEKTVNFRNKRRFLAQSGSCRFCPFAMQIMHSLIKTFLHFLLGAKQMCVKPVIEFVRSCNDKNDQLDAENREDFHDCVVCVYVAPERERKKKWTADTQLLELCTFRHSAPPLTHSLSSAVAIFAVCWFMRPFCWHMLNAEPIAGHRQRRRPNTTDDAPRPIISVPSSGYLPFSLVSIHRLILPTICCIY